VILDYKTGKLPSEKQQKLFSKQLLLMAAMAERGAFGPLGPVKVADAAFVGLGSERKVVRAPLADATPDGTWNELQDAPANLDGPAGYSPAWRWSGGGGGRYDHLARFGEWDHTTPVTPLELP
jgi:RecB family exonuclease